MSLKGARWLALGPLAVCTTLTASAGADDGKLRDPEFSGAWQLRAGATYRRLYDVPIYAGEFGVAFGGWDERGSDFVTLDLILPGRTENGLAVSGGSIGYRGDWPVSKLRLGFSAAFEVLTVHRITTDSGMSTGGFALSVFAGYDLYRGRGSALAVDLAFNVDPMLDTKETDDATVVWGPTLGLAYRL
jgi:hypothetical protein